MERKWDGTLIIENNLILNWKSASGRRLPLTIMLRGSPLGLAAAHLDYPRVRFRVFTMLTPIINQRA